MFGKKGQGAMEYLMTYGWAILVVMIVGIVMWQLGIFNLGSTSVTSSGFPKVKPQLTSCKMLTTNAFSCLFTNGAGTAITLTPVPTVFIGTDACTLSAPALNTQVGVGDNVNIVTTACPGATAGVIGGVYAVSINISYSQQIAGTTVTHTDAGVVKGPYE